jgi:CheY-like chemotaxis protein
MTTEVEKAGNNQNKPTILIVDDSRVVRVSMKKILGDLYNVIEAEDGEDGWIKIRSHDDIRCVFTDFSMPELDGFGLLGRIKASSNNRIQSLPVILVTGNEDDDSIRAKAKQGGFSEVVIKPFKPGEIRQCVGRYFPELQQAPAKAAPATDAVEVMRKEIERLKAQNAAFLSRAEQAERIKLDTDQEVVRIKAELEVAKLETAASGKSQNDILKAKEEIARIQSQLLSITNRAESAEAAHRKADKEIGELQTELSRRQHEFAEQQLHREEQIKQIQEELGKYRARVEEATLNKRKAEDEVKQLRTELMLRQQGAESEKSQRIDKLREEIAALHQDLEEARDEAQAARQIRKQVEQEMERSQSEVAALNERFKSEEESHERSKRMVERLREDREAAVARAEASEESLMQAEQAMEKLRSDMEGMKEEGQGVLKVKEEMVALRGEFDSLRIEKEAAEASQSELENELVNLSTSLEEMEQLKEAAEGRAIELQAALNDRREEEIKLRNQVAAMEAAKPAQASDTDIRQPTRPAKSIDPVENEMNQAFASLDDDEFKFDDKTKEGGDEGEVIELSGFWPDGESADGQASFGDKDKPVIPTAIRAKPREPEVMVGRDNGLKTKIAVVAVLLLLVGSGAAWMMGYLSSSEVPMAGEPAKAMSKEPVVTAKSASSEKKASVAPPPAKASKTKTAAPEQLATNKGTVERTNPKEGAPVTPSVSGADQIEIDIIAGDTETQEVQGAEQTLAQKTKQVEDAQPVVKASVEQPSEALKNAPPVTLSGTDVPVAPLESKFKEQEAQLRAEAEQEFERMMKLQKGGVVPPSE